MNLSNEITQALYDLGLTPKTRGFYHLRDAILIKYENPYLKLNGEGGVFDKIAKSYPADVQAQFKLTDSTVMRSVRYIANKCCASAEIARYIGWTDKNNITVARLVAGVAEYVRGRVKCRN